MGEALTHNPWHVNIIRGPVGSSRLTLRHVPLTSLSLSAICPASWTVYKRRLGPRLRMNSRLRIMVRFFVCPTADAEVPPEWREIRFPQAVKRVISRVSNRVYVGSHLCKIVFSITLMNLRKLEFHRPGSGVAGPQCRLHNNGFEVGHVLESVPRFCSTV